MSWAVHRGPRTTSVGRQDGLMCPRVSWVSAIFQHLCIIWILLIIAPRITECANVSNILFYSNCRTGAPNPIWIWSQESSCAIIDLISTRNLISNYKLPLASDEVERTCGSLYGPKAGGDHLYHRIKALSQYEVPSNTYKNNYRKA